jgi:hypothetical protein
MSLEKVTYTYRLPDHQQEALVEKYALVKAEQDLTGLTSVGLWSLGLQKWTSHAQAHMRHVTDWASKYTRRLVWRDKCLIVEFIRDPA